MIDSIRQAYNQSFSEAVYADFLQKIREDWPGQLDFRVAESPVFIPAALREKLTAAGESFIDTITASDFRTKTEAAIPDGQRVPGENGHTSFLAIDFAVCRGDDGELTPQLIELQGFPSVFAFQGYLSALFAERYPAIPESLRWHFAAGDYVAELKQVLLGEEAPEHCVLLEIFPEKQKTRIDFAVTEALTGVRAVCYTQIHKEGRNLFYDRDGVRTPIHRIYNRLIFDDLQSYPELQTEFQLTDDVDVTWVGHPNWFFRISKYILPLLKSPYVPETRYLSDFGGLFPEDLDNYVLKPLFSFAGMGVDLHPTADSLAAISDPQHYILQKKVKYEPVIQAPDGGVKCEIRLLYTWPEGDARPKLLTSLSRLSRGEMIGVRYNKDFSWVGASACFFEV